MILQYTADKDFEIVPELGGRVVRPGDKVIVRNDYLAAVLKRNGRWAIVAPISSADSKKHAKALDVKKSAKKKPVKTTGTSKPKPSNDTKESDR